MAYAYGLWNFCTRKKWERSVEEKINRLEDRIFKSTNENIPIGFSFLFANSETIEQRIINLTDRINSQEKDFRERLESLYEDINLLSDVVGFKFKDVEAKRVIVKRKK